MARRGTRAELISAQQTAHAKLIGAPDVSGAAPRGAAMVDAPLGNTRRSGGSSYSWGAGGESRSPGGFKKSGRMGGSTGGGYSMVGEGARGELTAQKDISKIPSETLRFIVDRGDRGATLSQEQLQIYQAYNQQARGLKTQEQKAEDKRQQAIDAEIAAEQRKNAEWDRRYKLEQDDAKKAAEEEQAARARADQKKSQEAEAQRIEWNRRHGIADNVRLEDSERKQIEAGTHTYSLAPEDAKLLEEEQAALDKVRRDGTMTSEELEQLQKEVDAIKQHGRYTMQQKQVEPNEMNIQVHNGVEYVQNGNGWTRLDDKQAEQAAALKQKQSEARNGYVLDKVNEARAEFKKLNTTDETIMGPDEVEVANPNYGKTFDVQSVIKSASEDWDAVYGSNEQGAIATGAAAPAGSSPNGGTEEAAVITPTPPVATPAEEDTEEVAKEVAEEDEDKEALGTYNGKSYL